MMLRSLSGPVAAARSRRSSAKTAAGWRSTCDIVGDRERRQRAAGDQDCLPTSTIDQLVGFESRSTMLPASSRRSSPCSWPRRRRTARRRRSFVPSPVIATIRPRACSSGSGRASLRRHLGEEVVDARLLRDHRGRDRVVASNNDGADARPPHSSKRSLCPALDDVLEVETPSTQLSWATTSGVRLVRGRRVRARRAHPARGRRSRVEPHDGVGYFFARGSRPSRSTPLLRIIAENGMKMCSPSSCSRRPNRSFASTTIERPWGISSASDASCAVSGSSACSTPFDRKELGRL